MQRPRIKGVFPPVPLGNGRIRIGADFGIASEIQDDDQGNVWYLLGLLDGAHTEVEIAAAMGRRCSGVTPANVLGMLGTLIDMGFVEDAATPPPAALSAAELNRYRRNLEFFSFFHQPPLAAGDFQLRLREASVTVLGLGGLGSWVAMNLAAIGVGHLVLVDHDRVELMNLNRQVLYTENDIGRSKVEAAAERLAQVNPHTRLDVIEAKVDGVAAARACMTGRDLLVCAADRPRLLIYQWLNEAALAEGVTWIRGGNDGLTVNLFMHEPYRTACFECLEQDALAQYPEFAAARRHMVEVVGDRTINPCTAPMAGMIGSIAALEVVRRLTGMAEPVTLGHRLVVDVQRMTTELLEGTRLDDCTVCGTGRRADHVIAG